MAVSSNPLRLTISSQEIKALSRCLEERWNIALSFSLNNNHPGHPVYTITPKNMTKPSQWVLKVCKSAASEKAMDCPDFSVYTELSDPTRQKARDLFQKEGWLLINHLRPELVEKMTQLFSCIYRLNTLDLDIAGRYNPYEYNVFARHCGYKFFEGPLDTLLDGSTTFQDHFSCLIGVENKRGANAMKQPSPLSWIGISALKTIMGTCIFDNNKPFDSYIIHLFFEYLATEHPKLSSYIPEEIAPADDMFKSFEDLRAIRQMIEL